MINVLHYQTLAFTIHGKIWKKSYKSNKFKVSAPTWNEEFESPDGSYSVWDIQDYFKSVLKRHNTVFGNPSKIESKNRKSKIENRFTFKINTGYYFELLTPWTIKLLGSTKSKITEYENGENVPHLEITEVILVHWNIVNNDYEQDSSKFLHIFVPNKSFSQLLDISSKNVIFSKTFNSEFSYIEVWFTDQISKPLKIEDKINITVVIN